MTTQKEIFKIEEDAAIKLAEIMKNEGKGNSLRVFYKEACGDNCGCGGGFRLTLDKKPTKNDFVFTKNGIKVIVDKNLKEELKGKTLKFVDTIDGSGFAFV
jgi:Fe-S cluster assembly iron-binding protein IscA